MARNLGRMIAAGAASHSDHGRDLVEVLAAVAAGEAPGYQIRDVDKLQGVAAEYEVASTAKTPAEIAGELAYAMQEDFGTRKKGLALLKRAPAKRRALWEKLGVTPRGIDRETSEMMHRTHMGVDNDWQSLLLHGIRNALSDGWGGSMIATDVSDILYGTPSPKETAFNVGVLEKDQVNIVVHGHNPVVSEMILQGLPVAGTHRPGGSKGRQRDQPRRRLLHRQRAAHAPRGQDGRQPPDDRAGALHRRRGHDAGGLPVHHARRSARRPAAITRA